MEMLDFNSAMTRLIAEITRTIPEFESIRVEQVGVSASFNSSTRRAGILAYVLPLKYRDGSPVETRVRGRRAYHYAMVPSYTPHGAEMLYIIYFMLPRFFHLALRDKIETIVHELYHLHPTFNGDLRRFKGRSKLHGSLKAYDVTVRGLTDQYLGHPHSAEAYQFLRYGYAEAERIFGGIQAKRIAEPKPRLLKVVDSTPALLKPVSFLGF